MNRFFAAGFALTLAIVGAGCVNPIPLPPIAAPAAEASAAPNLITPDDVSIDTMGLPYTWQASLVAATPYDDSQPPGPTGLPAHIEVLFAPNEADAQQADAPILYLIPVDAYRAMWDAAGNPRVSATIDDVFQWTIALQSPPPTSGLPALPPEEVTGANDLAVQIGRTEPQAESASRSGYRFVGRWAQDANPVTNQGLRYVYQGFTNDGLYLVAFFFPVTTPHLTSIEDFPAAEWDVFNSDPQAYISAQAEALNALGPADWEPDLGTLDAVVDSLRVRGVPVTGLFDGVWTWVATSTSGTETPVSDAAPYQVTYHLDGTLDFVADCHKGRAAFTWDGGMVGGMRTDLPAAELPPCTSSSQAQQLYDALRAAQDFRVQPGGRRLHLNLPAGGPVQQFSLDSTEVQQ